MGERAVEEGVERATVTEEDEGTEVWVMKTETDVETIEELSADDVWTMSVAVQLRELGMLWFMKSSAHFISLAVCTKPSAHAITGSELRRSLCVGKLNG